MNQAFGLTGRNASAGLVILKIMWVVVLVFIQSLFCIRDRCTAFPGGMLIRGHM
jgi:hypothetical protein